MRELEREVTQNETLLSERPTAGSIGVVGGGRLGGALSAALRDAGYEVDGPAGRGEVPRGEAILLCVPDAEIPAAAEVVAGAAPFVGHTSGATPLAALDPAVREGAHAFGLHPLQTVTGEGADLRGCGCAVAGSSVDAVALAAGIARSLGMRPFELDDDRRAAYHAAAAIASNFGVTLLGAAEEIAVAAGIDASEARELLAPLVRTTVDNWAQLGAERALTGPVARGDEATVAAHREAIAEARPELVPLFDALVERTRALAARGVPA
jgi:predicted short-subunit dehydrogenase-like oxidoreductase (DUF2520 family)